MTEIHNSLMRRYAGETAKKQVSKSWIPNRAFGNDPQEMMRRQINRVQDESEKTINNEELLNEIKLDIFQQVEEYLLEKHGSEMLTRKMEHFGESWAKFFGRYGNIVILALGELTDEINFLNHEGYIDKFKLSKQMESVSKRLGLQ